VLDQFRNAADNGFVATIVNQYLVESQSILARLHAAIDHRDAMDLTMCAHSLRGCSSTVGARRLAALCAELEGHGQADALDAAVRMVPALDAELTQVWQALRTEQQAVA
jgi:HPt (histidine-containing phosphotransfer) domain-containing protein